MQLDNKTLLLSQQTIVFCYIWTINHVLYSLLQIRLKMWLEILYFNFIDAQQFLFKNL